MAGRTFHTVVELLQLTSVKLPCQVCVDENKLEVEIVCVSKYKGRALKECKPDMRWRLKKWPKAAQNSSPRALDLHGAPQGSLAE